MAGEFKDIQEHFIGLNEPMPTTVVYRDSYYKLVSLATATEPAKSILYKGGRNNNYIQVGEDIGSTFIDLDLVVNVNGQIQFSIFSIPNKSDLIINEAIYKENLHYTLSNIGGNATLNWIWNGFQLNTTDKIIFRKH